MEWTDSLSYHDSVEFVDVSTRLMAQIVLAFKKAYFGNSIGLADVEAYTLKDSIVLVDFYVVFKGKFIS